MKSSAGIQRCMVKGKVGSSNADQSFVLPHSSPCTAMPGTPQVIHLHSSVNTQYAPSRSACSFRNLAHLPRLATSRGADSPRLP